MHADGAGGPEAALLARVFGRVLDAEQTWSQADRVKCEVLRRVKAVTSACEGRGEAVTQFVVRPEPAPALNAQGKKVLCLFFRWLLPRRQGYQGAKRAEDSILSSA